MIQSVDRAVRILFALQGARRMTLSELAAELGLAATTVHGIVRTLTAHGVVVQEHGGGRYQLGPAVLRLGNVYLDTLDLRARALTWAHDLAHRTGRAVRVGVLFGDDVVIIHHEPSPDGSRQMPELGIEIPAHASALGKAILAFLPRTETGTLRSMTGDTITSADDLAEHLRPVAHSGIALERDEAVLGESCIAGAIFDNTGAVVGAVGVVLPTADWPAPETVVDAVRTAARTISRELGSGRWPVPHGSG
ncbi:IclR family transcriptional regulator [Nocardia otitidiscaviarum]|uniref:Glycerol operon regulatory protein n=1 Tax=Nocardia otitidiscaviarum TaxID=1823 RepID=A0A516NLB9_9NOCA|nr:IclR family transcriptional regulator [Nocardia otitidiscaviarum]MBF6182085.1 IclR family transcriptional regulator [Nocardia otitidiscaviarum]MCP9619214.1 IclR family transcriptional regulator [Nocardia otitidiscaviarum]QDP79687.1 IclR family transcriptional regulator [Nocardia otitidiscaviarum]